MLPFSLKSFQCALHRCEDHVGKHLVEKIEKPYVGIGAEIYDKFCVGLFGKHREQNFRPSCWGASMLKNSIEDPKQFHPKFVRSVLKKFCCQLTFVTNFVDLETGSSLFLCVRPVGQGKMRCQKKILHSISELIQWWL